MKRKESVILNLSFHFQTDETDVIGLIAETGIQAVVDSMPLRKIRGIAYNYKYTCEVSKRRMNVESKKKTA